MHLIVGERRRRSPLTGSAQLARDHRLFTCVLLVGIAIRVLTMIAYTPALFFPDSWGYVSSAFSNSSLVGLSGLHPIGYSVLIRVLTLPGRGMTQLTAFQHLSGVLVGVVIYALLLRLRLPRWAAAAAAALVLLDGYTITLEQYVMSDTFFTAMLLATILLVAWPALVNDQLPEHRRPPASPRRAALAGLLLALTTLEREVAIFVTPVLVAYLLWTRLDWRPVVALLVAAAIPLGAYAALVDHKFHVFGMTARSGWALYGRVAGFADCGGVSVQQAARPLCETAAQRASHPRAPGWYIWGPSPARRLFHPYTASIAQSARADGILRSFSETIALHQPFAFASATFGDFLRYFTPNATPYRDSVSATSLPKRASAEAKDASVQQKALPGMQLTVQSPAGLVRSYRGVMHVPRPVLAILALTALLGSMLAIPGRREIFLLGGSAAILLLGTAATAGFGIRYLMPAVPLLAIGGTLALARLNTLVRSR